MVMKNIYYASLIVMAILLGACSENHYILTEPDSPTPESPEEPTTPSGTGDPEIPDIARFKIALYDYFSFKGEEYRDNPLFATPAPFDLIGFRIHLNNDSFSPFGHQPYQCYDSIVWSSLNHPETLRIFEETYNSMHFTSQWCSYFFEEGPHTVYLRGYKNGEAIHSDSLTFELKDRDFLCFNWAECQIKPNSGVTQGIYCSLDNEFEYRLSFQMEVEGKKVLNIYIRYRDEENGEGVFNRMKTELENFLKSHLGEPVSYEENEIKEMFKLLPADEKFGNLYENKTTRAIILHQQPDEETYRHERYYIHVESK